MKLKYYLRGAGIALILAVLLTNVSHRNEVSASSDISQDVVAEETTSAEDVTKSEDKMTLAEAEVEDITIVSEEESEVSESENDNNTTMTESIKNEEASVEQNVESSTSMELITEDVLSEQVVTEENPIYESEKMQTSATLTIEEGAQEAYLLNIVSGDDSGTVSRKLYNAGLVDSASEFDAFLMQHGYDKKIRVGTVEVPFGATWLEIAEKLAGK